MNPLRPLLESLRQRWRDRPLSPRELRELEQGLDPNEPLAQLLAAYRDAEPRGPGVDWPALRARIELLERERRAPGVPTLAPARLVPVAAMVLLLGLAPVWIGVLEQPSQPVDQAVLPERESSIATPMILGTPDLAVTEPRVTEAPDLLGATVTPVDPTLSAAAELDRAQARWSQAAGGVAPSVYRYTVTPDCFCTPEWSEPFQVEVRGDLVTVTRDGVVVPAEIAALLPTDAAAIYRFAAERIAQAGFRAVYDERTGLPLSIWSDPIPGAADDELGLTISELVIER